MNRRIRPNSNSNVNSNANANSNSNSNSNANANANANLNRNQVSYLNKHKHKFVYGILSVGLLILEIFILFFHNSASDRTYIGVCAGIFILTLLTLSKVTNVSKDIGFVLSSLLSMILCMIPILVLAMFKGKIQKKRNDRSIHINTKDNTSSSSSQDILLTICHIIILLESLVFILFLNYMYSFYNLRGNKKLPKYNFIILTFLFLLTCVSSYVSYVYSTESLLFLTDG